MTLAIQAPDDVAIGHRPITRRRFLAYTAMSAVAVVIATKEIGDLMSNAPLRDRVSLGAFAANEPWPDLSAHYTLETAMGVRFPTMSWFTSFDNGWLPKQATSAAATGHDLMICLQPFESRTQQPVPFADILAGTWNTRMDRFFQQASTFPGTITIRLAHEMNGNWYPWSLPKGQCTGSIDEWLRTWRYIVSRQRAIGGNIKWMWCVNSMDIGGVAAESYWPGADYVDVIGMDGYNGYGPWTSGAKLFQPMYERLCQLDPSAPIWIAEIGCRPVLAGERLSKAQWFLDFFSLTSMPRLTHVNFFNQAKESDWRITTDDVRSQLSSLLQGAQRITR